VHLSRLIPLISEALNKSIPSVIRQAHHERNQTLTVHPELVEGFNQPWMRFTLFSAIAPRIALPPVSLQSSTSYIFCLSLDLLLQVLISRQRLHSAIFQRFTYSKMIQTLPSVIG
jgi:hypothetical protein